MIGTSGNRRSLATTAVWLAAPLVIAGCGLLRGGPEPTGEATPDINPTTSTSQVLDELTTTTLASGEPGGDLEVDLFNNGVYCDGTARPAALVFGAEPGETISFTSPMPVQIETGRADERGAYQLRWTCEPHETALFWDVTAFGETSQRSASFQVRGSGDTPTVNQELIFVPGDTPLECNNTRQIVGSLENAEPGETIEFSSAGVTDIASGTADPQGWLAVNWRCLPEETAQPRTVKATGLTSGRSVTFTLNGTQPTPLIDGPIEATLLEDPFTCNRQRRPVARLTNLIPNTFVEFSASPSVGSLQSGRANSQGNLDVFWQCERSQEGTQWTLTAEESSSNQAGGTPRSASFSFTGSATANPTTVTLVEDPFVCDGSSHEAAVIDNFIANEYVDFTSPDTNSTLSQGQAGPDGRLSVRWQCTADDVGRQWNVTATGKTSGLDLTFTITGAAAPASDDG